MISTLRKVKISGLQRRYVAEPVPVIDGQVIREKINRKFEMHGEKYIEALLNGDFNSWLDYGERQAPEATHNNIRHASYRVAKGMHSRSQSQPVFIAGYSRTGNGLSSLFSDR